MILQWMLHIAAVSVLLTLAALGAERALRLWRVQARLVWLATMLLSLGLPLLSLAQALGWIPSLDESAAVPGGIVAPLAVMLPRVSISSATSYVGMIVGTVWALLTVALTVRFVAAARALTHRRHAWRAATVDGHPVHDRARRPGHAAPRRQLGVHPPGASRSRVRRVAVAGGLISYKNGRSRRASLRASRSRGVRRGQGRHVQLSVGGRFHRG